MKAKASTASSLSPLVDHVVIIVKENHTYDNYFGTFPNSEGDNKLSKEPNPPNVSPDHRHETWTKRGYGAAVSGAVFRGGYSNVLCPGAPIHAL